MCFPISLRWTHYTASKPPNRVVKNAKWLILTQSRRLLKNVCYKVSLSEKCQRQSCKAFTGLSNRAQMVCGDIPLNVNFVHNVNHPLARQPYASMLSGNVTHTLLLLQGLQCNMKFITMPINYTNWGIWMHLWLRISTDKMCGNI